RNGAASSVVMGMPSFSAWRCVASEVATHTTSSPPRTFAPNRSTNLAAVEPVPSPSFMPGSTNVSARSATASFKASWFMLKLPARSAPQLKERRIRWRRLPPPGREGAASASPKGLVAHTAWPRYRSARPMRYSVLQAAHQRVLDLKELIDAVVRPFAPDTAFLEAAERCDLR